MLACARRALEDFLRRFIAEDDHAVMIGEIALVEISALGEVQFAHLPIGHIHAAHRDGNHARAQLEAEVSVDLAAHRADDRDFFANGFHILEFVRDFLAGPLTACLQAGLSGPHHDHVVAHVHKGVDHASAEALAISQQQNDRGQAPHDSKHGERGTQAVAHERLPALEDEFF